MEYLIFSVSLFVVTAGVLTLKTREPALRFVKIEKKKN